MDSIARGFPIDLNAATNRLCTGDLGNAARSLRMLCKKLSREDEIRDDIRLKEIQLAEPLIRARDITEGEATPRARSRLKNLRRMLHRRVRISLL